MLNHVKPSRVPHHYTSFILNNLHIFPFFFIFTVISQKVNNLYNRIATVRSQVEKKEADRIKAKEKSLHILGRKSETIENHKIIPEWSSPQETITTVTETRQA